MLNNLILSVQETAANPELAALLEERMDTTPLIGISLTLMYVIMFGGAAAIIAQVLLCKMCKKHNKNILKAGLILPSLFLVIAGVFTAVNYTIEMQVVWDMVNIMQNPELAEITRRSAISYTITTLLLSLIPTVAMSLILFGFGKSKKRQLNDMSVQDL